MKKPMKHIDEARKVYDLFWDSYLVGDIDAFATTLDENFEMIGTSESERCHNKEGGIEFIKEQKEELIGSVAMRNREITELPIGNVMLINEFCDIYVLSETGWSFYSKFRSSAMLRETEDGWKMAQQHGSLPDMRVGEGETLAIEKITKENIELRDAVKRRTAELENKNRELEIEAALDRVRARSMAMHKSEELVEVVRQLKKEILELGIDIDVTQIVIDFTDDPDDGLSDWVSVEGQRYLQKFHIPFIDHPLTTKFYETLENDLGTFTVTYSKQEKNSYFKLLFEHSDFKDIPEERKNFILEAPGWVNCVVIKNNCSMQFARYRLEEFNHEEKDLFKRFTSVFGQAYTRFLDLKKAEEQAREAQIESSLERVRARGLAMQSTDDIESATVVVFNELSRLGISMERCGITLFDENPIAELWSTTLSQESNEVINIVTGFLDMNMHPMLRESYRDWKNGKESATYKLIGEEVRKYYDKLEKQPEYKFPKVETYPDQQVLQTFRFNEGGIFVYTIQELTEESKKIISRFTKVFEQTYTRFLDLQRAEEQAREAQIEAALEKVRGQSLAMKKSKDLQKVINIVSEQLTALEIEFDSTNFIDFNEDGSWDFWISVPGQDYAPKIHVPYLDTPIMNKVMEAKKQKKEHYQHIFSFEEKNEFFNHFFENTEAKKVSEERKKFVLNGKANSASMFAEKSPALTVSKYRDEPFSKKENEIFKRFANVFEQAFTRFLDLQNAEEQAREAQIEASLERVRAAAMAMHKSEELPKVSHVLYKEFKLLGLTQSATCGFVVVDEKEQVQHAYGSPAGKNFLEYFKLPLLGDTVLKKRYEAWKQKEPVFHQEVGGIKLKKHMDVAMPVETLTEEVRISQQAMPDPTHFYFGNFSQGYLQILASDTLSEEQVKLIPRFAKVFEQTYTRFLDLQKAEEQTREAKIEAALERVRSRSMGMRKSEELREVVHVLFQQMHPFGISKSGFQIRIAKEDNSGFYAWLSTPAQRVLPKRYEIPTLDHWALKKYLAIYEEQRGYSTIELQGDDKRKMDLLLFEKSDLKNLPGEVKENILSAEYVLFSCASMKYGLLEAIDIEPIGDENIDILKRFAKVFEQTYTRFLDIQRAEKLALETARQSSLDRIRAEIGSMRSSEDLQQITPIIWDELNTLNIPFIRCGVFIIDEENGVSNTYLSTSQGEPIAALHLPLTEFPLVENSMTSWKNKEIYRVHWDAKDFRDWSQSLIDGGFIQSKKKYSAGSVPKTLDLHFLPFKHGMLYIGNTEPLSQEHLDLGQSLASAFSVAYDRYEDFNKLEQAKQKIEEAFEELEAAKDQLVQQEKLASLGQLTAGIAHEIKNPLNFVNNFSDLSIELVEEAREELSALSRQLSEDTENSPLEGSAEAERRRGVSDEATNHTLILDILDDIKTNLQKIHKHGTRADGIVKSMLQHSRGGSGKMEPTDINALIKEYTNLAYHGMRAGKDPINVDIELDLDKNVKEVETIGEDFSRVILNLTNNAFDAMREKLSADSGQLAKSPLEGSGGAERSRGVSSSSEYEPKLTVRTHRNDQSVTIEIQDNGPGIPDDIKDKILQPFFTTKKGTAGTGLGLSITNDIIKAHGGSLEISSTEMGTSFNIIIPSS